MTSTARKEINRRLARRSRIFSTEEIQRVVYIARRQAYEKSGGKNWYCNFNRKNSEQNSEAYKELEKELQERMCYTKTNR